MAVNSSVFNDIVTGFSVVIVSSRQNSFSGFRPRRRNEEFVRPYWQTDRPFRVPWVVRLPIIRHIITHLLSCGWRRPNLKLWFWQPEDLFADQKSTCARSATISASLLPLTGLFRNA